MTEHFTFYNFLTVFVYIFKYILHNYRTKQFTYILVIKNYKNNKYNFKQ